MFIYARGGSSLDNVVFFWEGRGGEHPLGTESYKDLNLKKFDFRVRPHEY